MQPYEMQNTVTQNNKREKNKALHIQGNTVPCLSGREIGQQSYFTFLHEIGDWYQR